MLRRAGAFPLLIAAALTPGSGCRTANHPPEVPSVSQAGAAGPPARAEEVTEPAPTRVEASLGGRTVKLVSAIASDSDEGIVLYLADSPMTCLDHAGPRRTKFRIILPAGPGGRYYAGQVIAPQIFLGAGTQPVGLGEVPRHLVDLAVKLVAPDRGGRVAGTLTFAVKSGGREYRASGSFDAEVCNRPTAASLEERVPESTIAGVADRMRFAGKSAVAFLHHDRENGVRYIDRIDIFESDRISCASYPGVYPRLSVRGLGGASSRRATTGAPQPAIATWYLDSSHGITAGSAWVNLDRFTLAAGRTLDGLLFQQSKSDEEPALANRFAGRFRAIVCEHP